MKHKSLVWVALVVVASCGRTSHQSGTPQRAGAPAQMEPGDAGASGAGGAEAGPAGAGGAVQVAGQAGQAGSPPVEHQRLSFVAPLPFPDQLVAGAGPFRKVWQLEPTDQTTSSVYLSDVSDDYSVLVGTTGFDLRPTGYASSIGEQLHAFRWTEQGGTVPLVDEESRPIAMSADGSTIFVSFVRPDESTGICRWTADTGCAELEVPQGSVLGSSVVSRPLRSATSSDGDVIVGLVGEEPQMWRWSAEDGVEVAPLPVAGGFRSSINAHGDALLSSQDALWLWPRSKTPVALKVPNGFDHCSPTLVYGKWLLVGHCVAGEDYAHARAFEWTNDGTAQPWDGPTFINVVTPSGEVAIGTRGASAPPPAQTAVRWTVAGRSEPLLNSDNRFRLWVSDDGALVFGLTTDDTAKPPNFFRWTEPSGVENVTLPAQCPGEVSALGSHGQLVALACTGGLSIEPWLWSEAGSEKLTDAFSRLNISLRGLEPSRVRFIDEGSDPPLLIGEGLLSTGQDASPLAGIWVSRLQAQPGAM